VTTRVCLVCPTKKTATASPPVGLMYIAAVLRRAGVDVMIIDEPRTGEPVENLVPPVVDYGPDVVGISVMTATYPRGRQLAARLKDALGVPLVFGGPHATFRYADVLREAAADAVVLYEGEATMPALVQALAGGRGIDNIPGVVTRENLSRHVGRPAPVLASLDSLPLPARDLLPMDRYPDMTRGLLVTSRGCPYNCAFCSSRAFNGPRVRAHDIDHVLAEVEELVERYGCPVLNFQDDFFTYDRARLETICRTMIERGWKVQWGAQSRVDAVRPEMLRLMRRAGCSLIYFGTETAVQATMDGIDKRTTVEQLRRAVAWTWEAGIQPNVSLLVGLPDDTPESLAESLEVMQQVRPFEVATQYLTPFPGSPIGECPQDYGITVVDDDLEHYDCHHPVIETRHLTSEDMRRFYAEGFALNYDLLPDAGQALELGLEGGGLGG